MVTNNAINVATGATGTVLQGRGVGVLPQFTATPAVTSITFGSGSPLGVYVETGSFTPGLAFGGASTGITYTTQTGAYTQIGNIVFFSMIINLSSKGTATGNATITGLPVAPGGFAPRAVIAFANNITLAASYL